VGSFIANPYGLQDMNGNVQEWVQDCYRDSYQDAPADGRAVEASNCARRVVRGGGYTSASERLRSAARIPLDPDSRLDHVGFRVVRTH
jgi:formylglycine-generating enzyme required for sulfatase activity